MASPQKYIIKNKKDTQGKHPWTLEDPLPSMLVGLCVY